MPHTNAVFSLIFISSYFMLLLNEKRLEAEKQSELLKEQKLQVENSLALYQDEVDWGESVVKNHRSTLQKDIFEDIRYRSLEKDNSETLYYTVQHANRFIKTFSKNGNFYVYRARVHFIMQKFQKAVDDFAQAKSHYPGDLQLEALSKKYSLLAPNNSFVPTQFLPMFIKDLSQLQDTAHLYRVFNHFYRNDPPQQELIHYIRLILETKNPQWDSSSFKYDSQRQILSIDGQGLREYGYTFLNRKRDKKLSQSLFEYLPLKKLKLNNWVFFTYIFNIKVNELDFSETNLTWHGLKILECMSDIKTLAVSPSELSILSKASNPYNIKVVVFPQKSKP